MRRSPLDSDAERSENIRRLEVLWRAWFKQPRNRKQRARWHIFTIAMAWGCSEQDAWAARARAKRFLAEVDEANALRPENQRGLVGDVVGPLASLHPTPAQLAAEPAYWQWRMQHAKAA